MDEVMVVTGLVGALVASSYKWGYYVFAMVALIFIAWNVVFVGYKHAGAINDQVKRTYIICGVWTIFLWFIYPIAWGLSEGGNVIAPDSEAVFYGVLDILAKPVFGALLLWGHRNIDPATLGLHIRDYDDVPNTNGEKGGFHSAQGVTNNDNTPAATADAQNSGASAIAPGNTTTDNTGIVGTGHNHTSAV